jgi:hypothetical protein
MEKKEKMVKKKKILLCEHKFYGKKTNVCIAQGDCEINKRKVKNNELDGCLMFVV